jgi:2-polyprenyl-3-methyl-5-hydroxy-6-metoxy-1,4-benzoquinol methylase
MTSRISSEILAYYEQAAERERLLSGVFQLEFLRTKEVIDRWLPQPPAIVMDVGGGPGRYSAWLAERGYEVHLLDAVPELVEQARQLDQTHRIASFSVAWKRERHCSSSRAWRVKIASSS